MYKENSIKASERRRRTTVDGIGTIVSGFDQPLPVEIDRFWPVSKNKTVLPQLLTKWALRKVESENFDKALFLGGSHEENDVSQLCKRVSCC